MLNMSCELDIFTITISSIHPFFYLFPLIPPCFILHFLFTTNLCFQLKSLFYIFHPAWKKMIFIKPNSENVTILFKALKCTSCGNFIIDILGLHKSSLLYFFLFTFLSSAPFILISLVFYEWTLPLPRKYFSLSSLTCRFLFF